MQRTRIINAKLVGPTEIHPDSEIVIDNGVISELACGNRLPARKGDKVIDAKGNFVCPGFIDIHVNGADGYDVMDGTPEAIAGISRFHARHGTTTIIPTLVSSAKTRTIQVLEIIRQSMNTPPAGAKIAGAHLEGPYLSQIQSGAHDKRYVRTAHFEEYDYLFAYNDAIAILSAAPEIEGVLELVRKATRSGIICSIGHSHASDSEVLAGLQSGFTSVTHLFCALSSMHRKNARKVAGVNESALLLDDLYVEVIADGYHVPRSLMQLIYKVKPLERMILVTDAIRATGLPDGEYKLGDIEGDNIIIKEDGIAKTRDRSLYAGSVVTMDRCIAHTVDMLNCSLPEAVSMATRNPATMLGIQQQRGSIAPGSCADIAILDDSYNVVMTMVDGRIIHNSLQ